MAARAIGLLLVASLLLAAPPVLALIEPVGALGGTRPYEYELVSGYVYIATGADLGVYAASGSHPPLRRFAGSHEHIIRLGSKMMVGRDHDYALFDISTPSAPVHIGPVSGSPPPLGDFEAATQRYCGLDLAGSSWNLEVYDVSVPSAPLLLGATPALVQQAVHPNPFGSAYTTVDKVVVEQGRLFEQHTDLHWDASGAPLGGEVWLQVFRLADPANAQLIDRRRLTVIPPGEVTHEATFTVDGNTLYTSATYDYCCNADVLRVYEVDDDIGLVELGSLPADPELGPFDLHGVTIMDLDPAASRLRVWGFQYGEIDVSVPQSPELGCVLPTTPAPAAAVQGGIFVTFANSALETWNSDCSGFDAAARVYPFYSYHEPVVLGDVLYLGSAAAAIVDLQDVTNPWVKETLPMPTTGPQEARSAVPVGTSHVAQMELTTTTSALRVVNLSVPSAPGFTDFAIPEPLLSPATCLMASNGTIVGYLRSGPQNKSSLQLVDLGDPANPSLEGAYSRPSSAWTLSDTHDLEMLGDVAYVSVLDQVWVIDFSDLGAPALETTLVASGLAGAARVELSIAAGLLVTSDIDDHRLWSLADPRAPVPAGTLPLPANNTRVDDVEAVGGRHFLWHDGALHAFDLSQPAAPVLVESLVAPYADPSGPPALSTQLARLEPGHLVAYFGRRAHLLDVQASTSAPPVAQARLRTLLLPSVPNPSLGQTSIRWIPDLEQQLEVRIHDVAGRLIRGWKVDGSVTSEMLWDGRAKDGNRVASGVYYVSLRAGGQRDAQRVVIRR